MAYEPCSESVFSELAAAAWCSAVSPAAPQARGISVEGVNVNTTVTSANRALLAASYSDGNVKIFRNPAASVGAEGVNMPGHSKGKVSLAFNSDASKLFTVGAQDGAIIVWDLANA